MKLRYRKIKDLNGKFIGKVATIMCKTPKEFMKHMACKIKKHPKPIVTKVRPILNTEMLAVLDEPGEII